MMLHRRIAFGFAVSLMAMLLVPAAASDAHEADGHPARIQKGTCDALDGVAFTLTGVGATVTPQGTPIPEPEVMGAPPTTSVAIGQTTLDTSLTDLLANPLAIVIYESDEAMDTIVACGNIGGPLNAQMAGMIMPGDELAIWLSEAEDSGYTGLALLQANGMQANLRIFLAEGEEGGSHGDDAGHDHAAEATPAS